MFCIIPIPIHRVIPSSHPCRLEPFGLLPGFHLEYSLPCPLSSPVSKAVGRAHLSAPVFLTRIENSSSCCAQSPFTEGRALPLAAATVLKSSTVPPPLGQFRGTPKPSLSPTVHGSILEVSPEHPHSLLSSSFLSELIQDKPSLNWPSRPSADSSSTFTCLPLHS